MTEAAQAKSSATPWHFWVAAIVGVLWNGFGAYDYIMTNTGGEAYLRSMGVEDAMIAYVMAMPSWMTAVWAIGVWGGLAGAVLLLLRMKWALYAFAASLAGFLTSLVYYYVLSNGMEIMGAASLGLNGAILAGCLFFLWYAWFATKRGILR
jgi:hypothetical protein